MFAPSPSPERYTANLPCIRYFVNHLSSIFKGFRQNQREEIELALFYVKKDQHVLLDLNGDHLAALQSHQIPVLDGYKRVYHGASVVGRCPDSQAEVQNPPQAKQK